MTTITVGRIAGVLEQLAPVALQEDYDNCGLLVGAADTLCTGALLCVDVTEERVAEAVGRGCNMIVAHHPVIFKGLKRLTGSSPAERAVEAAVRGGVAIYACHTCLDNAPGGVSMEMARMLGLHDVRPLAPATDAMVQLTVYVPRDYAEAVRDSLFDAGCGRSGLYDSCSFSNAGTGTFRPLPGAHPFVGEPGFLHAEDEAALCLVMPERLRGAAVRAIIMSHPYEQPAYHFTRVEANAAEGGAGAVGSLPEPMTPDEFASLVKATFGAPTLRCSRPRADLLIRQVALCGGSGGSMIACAQACAQAYVTADLRYHDLADATAAGTLMLVDSGHYETEKCATSIFQRAITEKFPNFAAVISSSETNPVNYI